MPDNLLDGVHKDIKRSLERPYPKLGRIEGGVLVGEGNGVISKEHLYPVPFYIDFAETSTVFYLQPVGDVLVTYLEFDSVVVITPLYHYGDTVPIVP